MSLRSVMMKIGAEDDPMTSFELVRMHCRSGGRQRARWS
jgi:hypothetical protein